jgi:7-keto-8-aminopelargonate synthetase-like enzyme
MPYVMQSPPGAETVIDGRRYLYFAGTGYLGLQSDPEVLRAACEAMGRYGLASATSRSGLGTTPPLLDAEAQASAFFQTPAAFYFASGYAGNQILVRTLEGTYDAVFVDELSHYSVFDAARQVGRPPIPFRHRDPESLAAALDRGLRPGQRPLVMSDGVFSVLGHIAPLPDYCRVLAEYPGAALVVDDAHGAGVLGAAGRGTFDHFGLTGSVDGETFPGMGGGEEASVASDAGRVGNPSSKGADLPDGLPIRPTGPRLYFSTTLSKALGGFGGILPLDHGLLERVRAATHHYQGASAPPVPVAAASAKALQIVRTRPELRGKLARNVRAVKDGLRRLGLAVDDTPVPIVPLCLGTTENMQRIHRELAADGIMVPYLPAYSGLGPGGALRLAVFATHTPAMITQLLDSLSRTL